MRYLQTISAGGEHVAQDFGCGSNSSDRVAGQHELSREKHATVASDPCPCVAIQRRMKTFLSGNIDRCVLRESCALLTPDRQY